jgi:hypothetical protein
MRLFSRGLGLAALVATAFSGSLAAPPMHNSAYMTPNGPSGKALSLNPGLQAMREEAAMMSMLLGRQSGFVKHRSGGERAHRRWRHARSSGIKGARRG